MKSFIKIFRSSVITALIFFSVVTCDLNKDGDTDGPVLYKDAIKINKQQVWEGTSSNKISELYKKFEGERDISVNVYLPDETDKFKPSKVLGAGKIEKGLLSCDIPVPADGDLMDWDNFKKWFSEWNDINCVPKVNGTFLGLVSSENEWVNREKMSGTSDSLWLESIWFVYADIDCIITGTPGSGIRPGDAFYVTPENLNLKLKRGWNTVSRKQLLEGDHGIETDSVKIKNPNDFKWALRTVHP